MGGITQGKDHATGKATQIATDEDGRLILAPESVGIGGSFTGGDASAANQVTEIAALGTINTTLSTSNNNTSAAATALGSVADTKATDATSSWGVIALLKGVLNALLGVLSVTTQKILNISATPAVTASAYASGNSVGGLIALANAARANVGSGMVQLIEAMFSGGSIPTLDIVFFNANPSASTITDKTAVSIATADIGKIVGTAQINVWTSLGTPRHGQASNLALPFALPSGTTLYAAVITRTAFTPASTTAFTFVTKILPD